jgi:L-phenylalanine/L-methionine N-acetyltransferase
LESQDLVRLREVEYSDLTRFYDILQNPNVFTKIDLDAPPTLEDEIQWYHSIKETKDHVWTIEFDGMAAGNCRIFPERHLPENSAEFGIMIDEAFWGKGIGTFVCRWLIQYADETLKLDQLFLEVKHGNENAKRLYKKLGFKPFHTSSTHEHMVLPFQRKRRMNDE